jgi:hypothetical protein
VFRKSVLQHDAEEQKRAGNDTVAHHLLKLNERGKEIQRKLDMWTHPYSNSAIQIAKRGIVAGLSMLFLSLLASIVSPPLSTAFLFLTLAVVLMFVFAFDVESDSELFNQRMLIGGTLLSLALAMLSLVSILL